MHFTLTVALFTCLSFYLTKYQRGGVVVVGGGTYDGLTPHRGGEVIHQSCFMLQ